MPPADPLDPYEIAVLNGGPQLAITIAAAELHRRAELVRSGRQILANRRPEPVRGNGGDLEQEVFEAVERNPGTSPHQLRGGSPAARRSPGSRRSSWMRASCSAPHSDASCAGSG